MFFFILISVNSAIYEEDPTRLNELVVDVESSLLPAQEARKKRLPIKAILNTFFIHNSPF